MLGARYAGNAPPSGLIDINGEQSSMMKVFRLTHGLFRDSALTSIRYFHLCTSQTLDRVSKGKHKSGMAFAVRGEPIVHLPFCISPYGAVEVFFRRGHPKGGVIAEKAAAPEKKGAALSVPADRVFGLIPANRPPREILRKGWA